MQRQLKMVTHALDSPIAAPITTNEHEIILGADHHLPYPSLQSVFETMQEIGRVSQEINTLDAQLKKVNVKMMD